MTATGTLSLDSKLEDCTVGESKTITLVVTPTKNDESGFSADVDSVEDYEESDAEAPADKEEAPPPGKHGKSHMIISVALGSHKKSKGY